MDDDLVFPSREENDQKKGSTKLRKAFLIFLGIVLIAGIGGLSYFLGTRSNNSQQISLSPTPSEEPETSETPTPTLTPTDSKTGTPSITKKPTATKTPTPSPTPTIKTKILSSSSTLDGFRSSNGGGNSTLEIRAGRNATLVTRGFVSFDLSDIPSGVTIKEATLRLYQAKIIGNPYGAGGNLKVDHLTYGDSLDSTDYGMAALSSSFITLTSNNSLEWKDADVTDRVKDDIANARSRSQFRVHFQTENTGGDVTGDFAYFESARNTQGTGNTPQLVVKYY